ncbi:hypothetical protein AB9P05_11755 [Roseivirga sp. BDSF3-8]|uniref:hypothetical protein n=1 Tax=Roseivirga sp. BDSF3-8 TaxID=3241598 RepID=UPI0035319EB9
MNTLKLFFSSKVNLLSVIILLVVSLSSFAHSKKGGTELKASSEVYALTGEFIDGLSGPEAESKHTYRFVDAEGNVQSEMIVAEREALEQKELQRLLLNSDKLFSSQGTSYYLID